MPLTLPNLGNAAEVVGQTPWSARDARVPQPEQRYQHRARREQADGGVGRGPGVRPTIRAEWPPGSKVSDIELKHAPPLQLVCLAKVGRASATSQRATPPFSTAIMTTATCSA